MFKIKSIVSKDGVPQTTGKYTGLTGALCEPSCRDYGYDIRVAEFQLPYHKDYEYWRTSMIEDEEYKDGILVIKTENSIYTLEDLTYGSRR